MTKQNNAQQTSLELDSAINEIEEVETMQVYDLAPVETDDDHLDAERLQEHENKTAKKVEQSAPPRKPTRNRKVEQATAAAENSKPFGADEETETEFINEARNSGGANPMVDAGVMTLNNLIPAEVLTIVIDKGLSVLLPLALNSIAGTRLKPADFKLSAEEKKTMKPAIERAAQTIKINFNNPWVALGFVSVAVYGAKVVDKINFDDIDADDLGAAEERRPRAKSTGNKKRDYAAEYARRKEREGR